MTVSYSASSYFFAIAKASTTGVPVITNGPLTSCTLDAANHALPTGVSFDPNTCEISGTASAEAAQQTYKINATSVTSSASTLILLGVAPPLFMPEQVTLTTPAQRSHPFTASGGAPPFTYSTTSGVIDAAGVFTAAASQGSATITATDAAGQQASTLVLLQSMYTNGEVTALHADGNVVFAGGRFTRADPIAAPFAVSIDGGSGTHNDSFSLNGIEGTLNGLASDGTSFYAIGEFGTYRGTSIGDCIKVDRFGSLDPAFNAKMTAGAGFSSFAPRLIAASGSSFYVAGGFTAFNGAAAASPVRFDTAGTRDITFATNLINGFGGEIKTMVATPDGVWLGGSFSTFNGAAIPNAIAKLDNAGHLQALSAGGTGFDGDVLTIAIANDGIYVGGAFTHYNGHAANHITKIAADGTWLGASFDAAATPGFDNNVNALALASDALYVGGNFSLYTDAGGAHVVPHSLAKLSLSGALDSTFASTLGSGVSAGGNVQALALGAHALYVGGNFATAGGVGSPHLAKVGFDGTLNVSFTSAMGLGLDAPTHALFALGEVLYLTGEFTSFGGINAPMLARFDSSGNADAAFGAGLGKGIVGATGATSGTVSSIATDSDGNVYVAGAVSDAAFPADATLVKLDPSGVADATFAANIGTGYAAAATPAGVHIAVSDTVYVAGVFDHFKGASIANANIARLFLSGEDISDVHTGNGSTAGVITPLGVLFVPSTNLINYYGTFTTWEGLTATRIAQVNGLGLPNPNFESAWATGNTINGAVTDLAASVNATSASNTTTLFAVGSFTNVGHVLALSTNGALVTITNTPGFADGFPDKWHVAANSDAVYVTSASPSYNGVAIGQVAKLTTGGALVTAFSTAAGGGIAGYGSPLTAVPQAVALAGTSVVVAGDFRSYAGIPARGLLFLDSTSGAAK